MFIRSFVVNAEKMAFKHQKREFSEIKTIIHKPGKCDKCTDTRSKTYLKQRR